MPTRKSHLTKKETAKYLASARELLDAGRIAEIPLDLKDNWRPLCIDVAQPPASLVCELASGHVCYAIPTRLLSKETGMTFQDCQISTAWDNQILLEPFNERAPYIDFGGQQYQESEVLNFLIEDNLRVPRGEFVYGYFLASGVAPIPAEYRNFAMVPFELTLTDVFGREFRADGRLSVSRSPRRQNIGMPRGTGLDGPESSGRPPGLPVTEESRLKCSELLEQERKLRGDKGSVPGTTGRG